jgi:hypothetical protein
VSTDPRTPTTIRAPNPFRTPQQISRAAFLCRAGATTTAVYRGWLALVAEFPEMRHDLEGKAEFFIGSRMHREEVNGR